MTEDEDQYPEEAIDHAVAQQVVARVRELDPTWEEPDEPIDLGDVAWRPDLTSSAGKRVLHLHLTSELRSHLIRRFKAAINLGYRLHVVTDLSELFRPETVEQLALVDAFVHVIDSETFHPPGH